MAKACLAVMNKENPSKQSNVWSPVVTCIGVSASKFLDQVVSNSKIDRFFFTKPPSGKGKEAGVELELDEENDDSSDSSSQSELVEDEIPDSEQAQRVNVPDENVLETEPQTLFVEEIDSPDFRLNSRDEKHDEIQQFDHEKRENPKRTGFFASRNLKKDLSEQTIPPELTKQPAEQTLSNPDCLSIEEIFPDIDQIDMETVALLPLNLRRQILQKIEARKGENGKDNFVVCEKCNKQLLAEEAEEHKDFHLATELQEELSSQPSTSKNSVLLKSQTAVKKPSTKRSLKDQKKTSKDCKRSRTIESFFTNAS